VTSTAPLGDQYWLLFGPHEGVLLSGVGRGGCCVQEVRPSLSEKGAV